MGIWVVPNWVGDMPTWITTLAIVFAGYQLLSDRKRRAAEEDRMSKAQARKISAWTATAVTAPRAYGLVVSNRSDSTFHNVEVTGILHGVDFTANPVRFTVLPPGDYFVEQEKNVWKFPAHVDEREGCLRPYTQTDSYRVLGLDFTDNLNQRWSANEYMVLNKN